MITVYRARELAAARNRRLDGVAWVTQELSGEIERAASNGYHNVVVSNRRLSSKTFEAAVIEALEENGFTFTLTRAQDTIRVSWEEKR